jgi:hypothetical protein
MKKEKVYLSGKISGLDHLQALALFQEAEEKLIEKFQLEVVNPMKINHEHDLSWESYMKEDIKFLLDCDFIFMLDNWQESRGAIIELNLAMNLKIKVLNSSCLK